jgi:hypothetical protein
LRRGRGGMSDGKATKTAKTYQAHDIPQVYLKNFCDDSGKIWQLDKYNPKDPIKTNVI